MLIGHFVPSYRPICRDAVDTLVRCQAWCQANNHGWDFRTMSKQPIDANRNDAIRWSLAREHDLLLMQDTDCYSDPTAGALIYRLRQSMLEAKAAVVAVGLTCRGPNEQGRAIPNCAPVQLGEVYEARSIGTGLVLLDTKALATLPLPWFQFGYSDDGADIACSEDVYFSRYAIANGYRLAIDWTIPAYHDGRVALSNQPLLEERCND